MERIILFMRNRESVFVFRRQVHSEVLWEFHTEAETLIFVVKRPDDRNIVGCNMLCAFGHPVATFCDVLGVVGSKLTIYNTHRIARNICCDMLGWHVAIVLCVYLQRIELRWNTVFCSWESWIGILKDSNFSRRRLWIKGEKTFQSDRTFCLRYHNKWSGQWNICFG